MGFEFSKTFKDSLTGPLLWPVNQIRLTAKAYTPHLFRADLVAGLTVAVISVPQSMAYAIIAGVDPRYGLYTLIFQALLASAFNSMPLLSVGPTNTQALLVASIVTRLVDPSNTALYLQMVIAMTLVKGAVQLVMASARLGDLVRYVSHSVIVGFTAGAGMLIAAGQINNLLGYSVHRTAGDWPGIVGIFQRLLPHLGEISWVSVGLGVLSLLIVVAARRISKLAPGPLVAVGLTAVIVYLGGFTQKDFSLMAAIPRSFAWPTLPTFHMAHVQGLLTGGLAMALLGLIEAYSIGKALTVKRGGKISANQELFSQGLMNFVTSFLSCIPGSGSFSRSALNEYAGAETFLAGIFNGLFVLAIFLIFAPAAEYIPMACIAGILFVVGFGLIDWRYIQRAIRSNRSDALVCAITFLATLFAPLTYAVFIGVFLNIAVYLRKASHLHMAEMVRTPEGPFVERPVNIKTEDRAQAGKQVIFLQIEGDLFFAQAEELDTRLTALASSEVRVVVLRLKRTHSVDATVLTVLENFVKLMHERGKHVLLCGVKPEMIERMKNFGLTKELGEGNMFSASFGVFTSAKQALARAKQLIGASVDVEGLKEEDELENWAYQI